MKKFLLFTTLALTGLLGASSVSAISPRQTRRESLAEIQRRWRQENLAERKKHHLQYAAELAAGSKESPPESPSVSGEREMSWGLFLGLVAAGINSGWISAWIAHKAQKPLVLALGAIAAWKISQSLYRAYTKTPPTDISDAAGRLATLLLRGTIRVAIGGLAILGYPFLMVAAGVLVLGSILLPPALSLATICACCYIFGKVFGPF